MPRKRSATGPHALRYEDRMAQIWELRKAGASYGQIAQQMGINKGNLSRMVKRKLEQLAQQTLEGAEDIRRLELERLDVALLAIWPQVRNGNHGAIDRLVRIQERLTNQIADTIVELTGTEDVAVISRGQHLCMTMRGIRTRGDMVVSTMRGVFRSEPSARAEFLALTKRGESRG